MPRSCPMISTPDWALPGVTQAPGSWLLLAALALLDIVWAPRAVGCAYDGASGSQFRHG